MPAARIHRIIDPLQERFALADLPSIAPWVAEQIEDVGRNAVCDEIRARGVDPGAPQPMHVWVGALTALHDPLWEALEAG